MNPSSSSSNQAVHVDVDTMMLVRPEFKDLADAAIADAVTLAEREKRDVVYLLVSSADDPSNFRRLEVPLRRYNQYKDLNEKLTTTKKYYLETSRYLQELDDYQTMELSVAMLKYKLFSASLVDLKHSMDILADAMLRIDPAVFSDKNEAVVTMFSMFIEKKDKTVQLIELFRQRGVIKLREILNWAQSKLANALATENAKQ